MKYLLISLFLALSLDAQNMGALLFNGNCLTCHHKTESTSAPSMKEIKEHYLRAFTSKKDFVYFMSKWVIHPQEETSIMLDSVQKYKLMPHLAYDMSTLKDISAYIYDTEF